MSAAERWLSFAREDLRAAEILLLPGATEAQETVEIAREVLATVGRLISQ